MNDGDLITHLTKLEQQLARIEESHAALTRHNDQLLTHCEQRVEALEVRLKDFARIETLAYDAYVETHERAQESMLDTDRIVPMNISHSVFFRNLPSIKDRRNRSKS